MNTPKIGNSYQRTNLAVLWFLNTIGCWRQIVLAFFIYKRAFDGGIDCENCSNNSMYNCGEAGPVLMFKAYDVTAKLGMIYTGRTEYSNLLLSDERQRLFAQNPLIRLKITAK